MSNTKIKASQFHGVVGHGTDGYFLMTNADGSMSWSQASTGPSVTSVTYPGDDLAADPAGGQTVVLTGTGFATSGMTVTIGGTTAPSVSHDSNTQLTITTPAKAAGDYDIVVTNGVTGASGTFVNGISYNGVPTWTTAAGSLGTFESETTISTITLQATEPDGGTITFNITNGALPTGLSLTGANIDGTTTAESSTTLYSFTIEAIDDENQSTPRNFSITVNSAEIVSSENFTINTYTGNGSTQAIEGKIGTAADFNGSSSKISTNVIPLTNTSFSVSSWVNLNVLNTAQMIFAQGNTGNNNPIISIGFGSSQQIELINRDNLLTGLATTVPSSTHGITSTGTWYHVCVVFTTTTYNLYVNGSSVSTGSFTANTGTFNTQNLGVRQRVAYDGYLNGKLDQVRIFNKAISSSEVTTLYGESNTSTTKSTTDIFDDGSGVALYEFEKGAIDTGGTYNGTPTNVNFLGMAFQPDLVWTKSRSTTGSSHTLYDSVRGVSKFVITNATNVENNGTTNTGGVTSFNSNGFDITLDSSFNLNNYVGRTYVAWCWKAGGTAVSNTDGSITSTVSANQDAGFSIVKYTGTGNAENVGHGLSSAPEFIIIKNLTTPQNWVVYNSVTNLGNSSLDYGYLSLNYAFNYSGDSGRSYPTSTVFNIGTSTFDGSNNDDFIAYCFHSVDGYQKIGSYSGTNGTAQTITTGFQPRWVLIKSTGAVGWYIVDSQRGLDKYLTANTSDQEGALGPTQDLVFTATGFTVEQGNAFNGTGTYIYLAIA